MNNPPQNEVIHLKLFNFKLFLMENYQVKIVKLYLKVVPKHF